MKYKLAVLNEEFKAVITGNTVMGSYAMCAIITTGYETDATHQFVADVANLCGNIVESAVEDDPNLYAFYVPVDSLTEFICMRASVDTGHDFEEYRRYAGNLAIVRVDTEHDIYDVGITGPRDSKFAKSFAALMQEKYPTVYDFMSMLKENVTWSSML